MIVADRFVLLHLHKSGGSFANALVLRHFPDAREVGYHLPRRLVPASHAGLPVLGFVRNPWSYYVSWYSFQRQRPQPNLLFRVLSEEGRLDFAGTIGNMLRLGERAELLDALVAGLPREYGNRGLNLPGSQLESIRGSGLGFYSFLHRYMYGEPDAALRVGRMEALREEFIGMLEATGQPLGTAFLDEMRHSPPRNTSRHGGNADYYDAPLRELVARRDGGLIERYGYGFA